jgi:hypothetical protein
MPPVSPTAFESDQEKERPIGYDLPILKILVPQSGQVP